jgi:hypothetical protein
MKPKVRHDSVEYSMLKESKATVTRLSVWEHSERIAVLVLETKQKRCNVLSSNSANGKVCFHISFLNSNGWTEIELPEYDHDVWEVACLSTAKYDSYICLTKR